MRRRAPVLAAIGLLGVGILLALRDQPVRRGGPETEAAPPMVPGSQSSGEAPEADPARQAPLVIHGFDPREALEKMVRLESLASLRAVVAAQARFMATGLCDADRDGVGEAGTLAELSGAMSVRGTSTRVDPPLLPVRFREAYYAHGVRGFHLVIPDDTDRAESAWFCVTDPADSACRQPVLLTTQAGRVFVSDGSETPRDPATAARFDPATGGYVPDPAFGKWVPAE